MDQANKQVCGPAISHLFKRALQVYGDTRYVRLAELSVSHLYNLRKSTHYRAERTHFVPTRAVCNPIGIRRPPRPQGRAGFIRVDLVRHSNDNALAESKNASVVRKHMRYSHIPQQYADPINAFYQTIFNPWLNLHRPCLFATETVNVKGKIVKRYKHADVKTPLECLTRLHAEKKVTLKNGVTIKALQAQANAQSDLVAAQLMQKAKARLFESFKKTAVKRQA